MYQLNVCWATENNVTGCASMTYRVTTSKKSNVGQAFRPAVVYHKPKYVMDEEPL